jgi:hypothetical protein
MQARASQMQARASLMQAHASQMQAYATGCNRSQPVLEIYLSRLRHERYEYKTQEFSIHIRAKGGTPLKPLRII